MRWIQQLILCYCLEYGLRLGVCVVGWRGGRDVGPGKTGCLFGSRQNSTMKMVYRLQSLQIEGKCIVPNVFDSEYFYPKSNSKSLP